MKDEPWRGNPAERVKHLERKLSSKKARIRQLEAANAELQQQNNDLTEARSQLAEARETMHCAVLKIQDGSATHAEGVLIDFLSRVSEANEQRSRLSPSPKQGAGGSNG